MKYDLPAIQCDGGDGFCTNWTPDYYEQTADSVDGVKITRKRPAPGWMSVDNRDYCPEHTDSKGESDV